VNFQAETQEKTMSDKNPTILIVDDEPAIQRFLGVTLSSQGYEIVKAVTGQEALLEVDKCKPDLVILDLGLPDIDGMEVTRQLRKWTQVPIIVLSVRDSEKDKIAALDAGADDYLTKPFGTGELLARIRVAWRHQPQSGDEPRLVDGEFQVDWASRVVKVSGQEIQLTPTEYEILKILLNHAGRVVTHRQLLHEVWGAQYGDELHMLHVNISNLRRKIEPDPARPHYIITEPGVGYRLKTV
jgi:two-component system KDP operon response regulator KdpE